MLIGAAKRGFGRKKRRSVRARLCVLCTAVFSAAKNSEETYRLTRFHWSNDGTDLRGQPVTSELETDAARPRSVQ